MGDRSIFDTLLLPPLDDDNSRQPHLAGGIVYKTCMAGGKYSCHHSRGLTTTHALLYSPVEKDGIQHSMTSARARPECESTYRVQGLKYKQRLARVGRLVAYQLD